MGMKLDLREIKIVSGSSYPPPFADSCAGRSRQRLGEAAGLTDFGVNLTRLPAGTWSSQRHWHTVEDEFIYVVEGEVVLVTDSGEVTLHAGDCAGFKAGIAIGHHLQNRTTRDVLYLEVGARRPRDDAVTYPGIDLQVRKGEEGYSHADGKPYT